MIDETVFVQPASWQDAELLCFPLVLEKKAVDINFLIDGTVIPQHFIGQFVIYIFAAGCQYCRHKKETIEIV